MAEYANAFSRAVAVIIDSIILFIIMLIIAIPFGLTSYLLGSVADPTIPLQFLANSAIWGVFSVINIVVFLLYFTYFETTSGQTIGKKIMAIKVVKEGPGKITTGDGLIRTVLRVIDGIALYLLGLIIIMVSDKQQRLGDMAAKTKVVKA